MVGAQNVAVVRDVKIELGGRDLDILEAIITVVYVSGKFDGGHQQAFYTLTSTSKVTELQNLMIDTKAHTIKDLRGKVVDVRIDGGLIQEIRAISGVY